MIASLESSSETLPYQDRACSRKRSQSPVGAGGVSPAHRNQDKASKLPISIDVARDHGDMARLAHGDEQALDSLMQRHAPRLLGLMEQLVKNRADAEELVQETFLRVYWHRLNFNPEWQFSRWLYVISSHLGINLLRWRARRPEHIPLLESSEETCRASPAEFADPGPTPCEQAERNEWNKALGRALARLPAQLREPLLMTAWDGCSQAQVAQRLGCTVKAVEMRICYGRKRLHIELERILKPWRCRVASAIRRHGPP